MFQKKDTKNTKENFEALFKKAAKKLTPERVEKAIKEGRLIPFSKIYDAMPEERKKQINERVIGYEELYKIREARKEQGLSQQGLADKVGVPRSTISKIERGFRNVTWETFHKVLNAVGLEIKVIKKVK